MMKVDKNGWLDKAVIKPSPNFDKREASTEIKLLVIHNISLPPACYEGNAVERFFLNQLPATEHPYFEKIAALKVSAHLFIRRKGEIIQFVSFADRAWHAGQSCFKDEKACNNYSIGIELEGTDSDCYTDEQYAQLQSVTEALHRHYPAITADQIAGHEHIAPGRKTDPGPGFDWRRYLTSLSFTSHSPALPRSQQTKP